MMEWIIVAVAIVMVVVLFINYEKKVNGLNELIKENREAIEKNRQNIEKNKNLIETNKDKIESNRKRLELNQDIISKLKDS